MTKITTNKESSVIFAIAMLYITCVNFYSHFYFQTPVQLKKIKYRNYDPSRLREAYISVIRTILVSTGQGSAEFWCANNNT